MFFDSNIGQSVLKIISKGTTFVTISSNGLEKIEIPLISLDKQNEKVKKIILKCQLLSYIS